MRFIHIYPEKTYFFVYLFENCRIMVKNRYTNKGDLFMKNERKFYRCSRCGNIISFVHNAGPAVVCCGEQVRELTPNTSDGAHEKHVPAVVRENGKLTVTVGSVAHPMTEEHHIAWIVTVNGDRTQRVALKPAGVPSAEFTVTDEPVAVYAYCNLHGLWVAEA